MTRERGSEGGEGEQVQMQLVREQLQMQLVRCPPMHHWYILQCN